MSAIDTHDDLSKALIAASLDIPSILDIPEIAQLEPEELHPAMSPVWHNIRQLAKVGNLTVSTLVSEMGGHGFDLYYFNKLRDDYRDVSIEDLTGIAQALRRHHYKKQLDQMAGWLATEARNGRTPQEIARDTIEKLTPIALQSNHEINPLGTVLADVYQEIEERSKAPGIIWGVPYAYDKLNRATGGKQKGELILLAGEPKVGKSWWTLQDALYVAKCGIPVAIFSLEMRRKQVTRRLLALEGMDLHRTRTGFLEADDWETLSNAIGTLDNLPLFIDDSPMSLHDLRPTVTRLRAKYGIEYFVLDYSLRVLNSGKDEIEKTNNVALECKTIVNELDIAGTLIASVNKAGMDTTKDSVSKANVRGSGQQIHEADIIYILTKYAPMRDDKSVLPADYDKYMTLHITAGRELAKTIEGGIIHYKRNPLVFEEKI